MPLHFRVWGPDTVLAFLISFLLYFFVIGPIIFYPLQNKAMNDFPSSRNLGSSDIVNYTYVYPAVVFVFIFSILFLIFRKMKLREKIFSKMKVRDLNPNP